MLLSDDDITKTVNEYAALGDKAAVGRALGISESSVRRRLEIAHRRGIVATKVAAPAGPSVSEEQRLRDAVKELQSQLKSLRSETLDDQYVKRKIIGLKESIDDVGLPDWTVRKPVVGRLPGVPSVLWSDWHWGEVVNPSEIGGVNAFDLSIAQGRCRRLVEKTIYLLRHHVVNPDYPGLVVNLGGDMVSGDIHDELSQTNDAPMMPVLLDLFGHLSWAIAMLADEFGRMLVPCVPGNHGRMTRKPRAKQRAFTNFDWLLYQFLAKSFEDDSRVEFLIPDGPDALYSIYGHKYLLTHGDQFRGGDGMIGHFGPVLRGHKKKLSRNANMGLDFDVLLHGHFHTYFPTQKIIGNGSLKGYDEYSMSDNFSYEPPIQALWLTHYEHGVTQHLPVYLEPHAGRAPKKEWVTWKAA